MQRALVSLVFCGLLAGCGTSSNGGAAGAGGSSSSTSASGDTATATSGNTGSGGSQGNCPTGQLCLDPPAKGFQVQTVGGMIQPGQDVETCEVVQLPGKPEDTYYVNQFEVAMTTYSHHLLVAAAIPGSATEKSLSVGMKKKCSGPDGFGGDVYGVTGSQHPYHSETYPPGVGKTFYGGQMLVFDYHYFNTSTAPVQARSAVNFHTVDKSQVTKTAHNFGFYNLSIFIPAQSKKAFTGGCIFDHDILVSKLTRHTHQWGTDFDVYYQGGDKDGAHIWTTPNYEQTEYVFDQPILMKKGTGFRFTCSFNNTTAGALKFGLTASDEMCILFGTWFVVNPGDSENSQDCIVQ